MLKNTLACIVGVIITATTTIIGVSQIVFLTTKRGVGSVCFII